MVSPKPTLVCPSLPKRLALALKCDGDSSDGHGDVRGGWVYATCMRVISTRMHVAEYVYALVLARPTFRSDTARLLFGTCGGVTSHVRASGCHVCIRGTHPCIHGEVRPNSPKRGMNATVASPGSTCGHHVWSCPRSGANMRLQGEGAEEETGGENEVPCKYIGVPWSEGSVVVAV